MARMLINACAAALGAAGMYLLDPQRGRRRRALLRDRITSVRARMRRSIGPLKRDSTHRLQGLRARAASPFARGSNADDVLLARVRATLGHHVSHPRAVGVTASGGRVMLTGDVLQAEHDALLRAVRAVNGVAEVEDRLQAHVSAKHVSRLQGGPARRSRQPDLMQDNWAPATRALVAASGTALVVYGLARDRVLAAAAGTLLLVRSAANRPLREALGAQGRGAIRVQKTMLVDAPADRAYDALRNYDDFPQFMRNVRRVEVRPNGTSHWTVAGPGGINVEWDATTTRMEENRLIAWATTEGGSIDHQGMIRLTPYGDKTQIHVVMTYTPIAGALGHLAAVVLGADPKAQLDEDMLRMKAFLEKRTAETA